MISTPSKYEVQARIAPALLCCAPFVATGFYFLNKIDASFWGALLALNVGGIGMSYALYRLAVQACRLAGKYLEERIYKGGKEFPTTTYLLDDDTNCSQECKTAVIAKIKAKFKIDLQGKTNDSQANRTAVHEAVGLIRSKSYENNMVLQTNIHYGFTRNLAGGSIVAAIVSVIALVGSFAFSATTATYVLACLLTIYTVAAIVSYWAIRFTAKHYAHTLFTEFLAS